MIAAALTAPGVDLGAAAGGALTAMGDMAVAEEKKKIREAFAKFDKNNDGFLTPDEIVAILIRPGGGTPMYKEDAEAFVKKHDKNKDGKLDLGELSEALALAANKVTRYYVLHPEQAEEEEFMEDLIDTN